MLPAASRLRTSRDFTEVMRRGRRSSAPTLSVHLLPAPGDAGPQPVRAGLIVSKAVGGSVVRHRVARRLRHLLAERLDQLSDGSRLVVRAAPAAGQAGSQALGRDLDAALARIVQAAR